MEETVSAGGDGLVAVDTSRADDTDGGGQFAVLGVHILHDAGLNARCVRTQQDVLGDIVRVLTDKEGVLHVAGRMVCCKVHLGEHMQVVLHLRTVCQHKAHA